MNPGRSAPLALFLGLSVSPALAGPTPPPPDYDFQWATITDPGNPAYDHPGPDESLADGRGSVSYKYRISQLEVTTGQWLEFANTIKPLFPQSPAFLVPTRWGAEPSGALTYELRDIPHAAKVPVSGITWREAAMFVNWLCNSKAANAEAIADGAYDTSTFVDGPNGTFLDQRTHHPDAPFWIPTWDEWLKAAHFDPDRHGPDEGGYWIYPNTSDTAPVPGIPGQGDTSAGLSLPMFAQYDIPLGSYPHQQSPWGLLDLSGAAQEWTEEAELFLNGLPVIRLHDGSPAGRPTLHYRSRQGVIRPRRSARSERLRRTQNCVIHSERRQRLCSRRGIVPFHSRPEKKAMSCKTLFVSLAVALMACSYSAQADINVEYRNSSLVVTRTETYDAGKDITLNLVASDFAVNVFADDPEAEDVGEIAVVPADSDPVWLIVSPNVFFNDDVLTTAGCRDLGGVVELGVEQVVRLKALTTGDVVGQVNAATLWTLFVLGDVDAGVVDASPNGIFRINVSGTVNEQWLLHTLQR